MTELAHEKKLEILWHDRQKKLNNKLGKYYSMYAASLSTLSMAILMLSISPILFGLVTASTGAFLVVLFSAIPAFTISLTHNYLEDADQLPVTIRSGTLAGILAAGICAALVTATSFILPIIPFTAPSLIGLTIVMGFLFSLATTVSAIIYKRGEKLPAKIPEAVIPLLKKQKSTLPSTPRVDNSLDKDSNSNSDNPTLNEGKLLITQFSDSPTSTASYSTASSPDASPQIPRTSSHDSLSNNNGP